MKALKIECYLQIANIFHRFLQCFEEELKAYCERVRMAAGGYPVNPHQVPIEIHDSPQPPNVANWQTDNRIVTSCFTS